MTTPLMTSSQRIRHVRGLMRARAKAAILYRRLGCPFLFQRDLDRAVSLRNQARYIQTQEAA